MHGGLGPTVQLEDTASTQDHPSLWHQLKCGVPKTTLSLRVERITGLAENGYTQSYGLLAGKDTD